MKKSTSSLPLAKPLGIPPKKVVHYLTKALGEEVQAGQVVARKTGFLGLGKKEITSPVDGKLVSFNEDKGVLIIETEQEPGLMDKIKEKIEGIFGFGEGKGKTVVLEEKVSLQHIQQGIKGKVMVCKRVTGKGVLFKLEALGASGLVVCELEEEQKKELTQEVEGKVDLGLLFIDQLEFNDLQDKEVFIDGKGRKLCVLS